MKEVIDIKERILQVKDLQHYSIEGNNLKAVDTNGYIASIVGIITTDPFIELDANTVRR